MAGTILAGAIVLLSIRGGFAPLPASPPAAWHVLPAALALGGLACLWRRPAHGTLGGLLIVLALPAATWARFGADEFSRWVIVGVVGLVVGVFVLAYTLLPIRLWKQAWPATTAKVLVPLQDGEAKIPEWLAPRVAALEALGFVPRVMQEDPDARWTGHVIYLLHDDLGLIALAVGMEVLSQKVGTTVMMTLPSREDPGKLAVTDAADPPLLPGPGHVRTLNLPGSSAPSLLEILKALQPPLLRTVKPLSGEDLAALLGDTQGRIDAFWVERGYLRAKGADGAHRYTLKGLAVATMRTLWPGRAILLDRSRREADAALRRQ